MDISSSQFLPASLMSMRRTSTGSLNNLRKGNTSHHEGQSSSSSLRSSCRHNPIAGGSWDDNSVGHGSVAARMRRERNRAIQRTKSSTPYVMNSINTHAHITSTLNLINTASLSPWKGENPLPWDDDFDLTTDSAASKRSAGSLCNIRSPDFANQWDARSVPDNPRTRHPRRTPNRHSYTYTSAHHHSSPTSGCASIAGSDIDSSDRAFFSMTDDSSFFDGDSLFSDSYAMLDGEASFSSNIYNLLEEGAISCRTPFLNGDWPDSISELDFDCGENRGGDISNCDAHSDIGPICSAPDERNRLKKRQVRAQPGGGEEQKTDCHLSPPPLDPPPLPTTMEVLSSRIEPMAPFDAVNSHLHLQHPLIEVDTIQFSLPIPPILGDPPINVDSFLVSPASSGKSNKNEVAEPFGDSHMVVDLDGPHCSFQSSPATDAPGAVPVEQTLASNLGEWNNLPKSVRAELVEQLGGRISRTMGIQDQLQIFQILGSNHPGRARFPVSIDDIDSHKLSRVLGYIDTHKPTSHCQPEPPASVEGTLRRSNSDGNIAKSALDAQKEHRRQQRQARRLSKWLKLRERKESRQHLKEQRSGLFVKEEKLKIRDGSEEEEVEV